MTPDDGTLVLTRPPSIDTLTALWIIEVSSSTINREVAEPLHREFNQDVTKPPSRSSPHTHLLRPSSDRTLHHRP